MIGIGRYNRPRNGGDDRFIAEKVLAEAFAGNMANRVCFRSGGNGIMRQTHTK